MNPVVMVFAVSHRRVKCQMAPSNQRRVFPLSEWRWAADPENESKLRSNIWRAMRRTAPWPATPIGSDDTAIKISTELMSIKLKSRTKPYVLPRLHAKGWSFNIQQVMFHGHLYGAYTSNWKLPLSHAMAVYFRFLCSWVRNAFMPEFISQNDSADIIF